MSEEVTLDDFTTEGDSDGGESTLKLGPKQSEIPDSWEVSTFEEVNNPDKPIGYGVVKPGEDIDDGTPLVKIEDVVNGYLSANQDFHQITEKKDEKYSRSRLSGGEVLVSIQGTVGNTVIVPPEMEGANISRTIARISPENPNNLWIKYYIESKPVQDYIQVVSSGSTRASYNIGDIRKTAVSLPPLPEQRKIATVLNTVDRVIKKTEQIVQQAERVKEGVVQENVFDRITKANSPTELGEVPEEWEIMKLNNVASTQEDSLVDGPFGSSLKAEEFIEDGFARILQLQNVKEGRYSDSNVRFVDEETYEELERHSAKPGDVFIAKMASPVARACILPDEYENYMLGCADVVKLIPSDDFVDEFVMYCLNSYPVWKQAAAHIRGSGRLRVNLNQLKEVELPKPPLREQKKIVTAVNGITDYIEAHKKEKERLLRLKEGLMQDLLSGTVRTTDTNIEVPEEITQHG